MRDAVNCMRCPFHLDLSWRWEFWMILCLNQRIHHFLQSSVQLLRRWPVHNHLTLEFLKLRVCSQSQLDT